MKHFANWLMVVFSIICTTLFTACTDNELTDTDSNINMPEADKTVNLSRSDGTTTLQIPLSGEWTATTDGEWLTLINESGTAAEAQVYNEQNAEDEDRAALVTYTAKDGSTTYKVAFVQQGVLSDDSNTENVADVERGCGVGWGYNGYGKYADVKYIKAQIINSVQLDKLMKTYPNEFDGELMMVDDKSVDFLEGTKTVGSSSSDLSNNLGVDAGLDVNLPCGFSVNITANYDKKDLSNSDKNFSQWRYKYVFKQRILDADNIAAIFTNTQIDYKAGEKVLAHGFRNWLGKISKSNASNREKLVTDFISHYGTHIISRGDIGGRYDYSMTTDKSDVSSEQDIKAALEMGYKKMFKINGNVQLDKIDKKVGSNYSASVKVYGGDSRMLAGAVNNVEGSCTEEDINKWLATVKEGACTLVDFALAPIWYIIPETYVTSDGLTVAAIVEQYLTSGKILSTTVGQQYQLPALSTPAAAKFELPAIDDDSTQVYTAWCAGQPIAEVCKEYVPALATRQRVVVVYPIKENKPDYSEGFFIGNEGHRAGKVVWFTQNDSLKSKYIEDTDYGMGEKIDTIYITDNSISGHSSKGGGYGLASTEPTYLHFYKGKTKVKGDYRLVKIGKQVYTRDAILSHYGFDGLSVDSMLYVNEDQFYYQNKCVDKFGASKDTRNLTGYCLPSNQDFDKTFRDLSTYSTAFMQGGVSGLDLKCNGCMQCTITETQTKKVWSWKKFKYITVEEEKKKEETKIDQLNSAYLITSDGWIRFLEGAKLEVMSPDSDSYPMRLRRIDGFSYQ